MMCSAKYSEDYLSKDLEATNSRPPVSFACDKMTNKHRTKHIAGLIVPVPENDLDQGLLQPIFCGMPEVKQHTGKDIANQMLEILEDYVDPSQVESFANDGQYTTLNVKKHIFEKRPELNDQFIPFFWDPAHIINLADKDARALSKEQFTVQNMIDVVKEINLHLNYGKHFNEYEECCEELKIHPYHPLSQVVSC